MMILQPPEATVVKIDFGLGQAGFGINAVVGRFAEIIADLSENHQRLAVKACKLEGVLQIGTRYLSLLLYQEDFSLI